nr:immunoglobulin light chain junction region [Macaca mulatta]
CQQYNYWISF